MNTTRWPERPYAELAELQRAFASLDGEVAQLRFTREPASVERAIAPRWRRRWTAGRAAYSHNPMVVKIVESTKEAFRKKILEIRDEHA